MGGQWKYALTEEEIAITCASHSGTDEHVRLVQSIHRKVGLSQDQLLFGSHPPIHKPTRDTLIKNGEKPSPYRHNCSGKHSGMLALAQMLGATSKDYLNPQHPAQQLILDVISEMCSVPVDQIAIGIDGCSAPNFAIPLYSTALGYARLCDPKKTAISLSPQRISACQTITAAIATNPEKIAGPDRFDTDLMLVAKGKVISKGGAEGYQAVGIFPGALSPISPAIGVALKIADGDPNDRARPAVAMRILQELRVLSSQDMETLSIYGPELSIKNWRQLDVGHAYPVF
jgi:L-asparaginase II